MLLGIVSIFTLAACSNSETDTSKNSSSQEATTESSKSSSKTVEITDAHGKVDVPVNASRVVSLDNRTFETVEEVMQGKTLTKIFNTQIEVIDGPYRPLAMY